MPSEGVPLLLDLPTNVLIHLCSLLSPQDLARLSLTAKKLFYLVESHGWGAYYRSCRHFMYTPSITPAITSFSSSREKIKFISRVEQAWSAVRMGSRQLCKEWTPKSMPRMILDDVSSNARLLYSVGAEVYSIPFNSVSDPLQPQSFSQILPPSSQDSQSHTPARRSPRPGGPIISSASARGHPLANDDITSISTILDQPDHIILSHFSGAIQQVKLFPGSSPSFQRLAVYNTPHDQATNAQDTCTSKNIIASVSYQGSRGTLSLHRIHSDSSSRFQDDDSQRPSTTTGADDEICQHYPLEMFPIPNRPWTVLLSPFLHWVAVGLWGEKPLSIRQLTESSLDETPLHQGNNNDTEGLLHVDSPNLPNTSRRQRRNQSIYALRTPPISTPFFASSYSLIAGKHDSTVDIYDLRTQNSNHRNGEHSHNYAGLRPVMTLSDRWNEDPIYSCAVGGGSGAYVAAGTGTHGMVRIWDARAVPERGVSLYSQGHDASPVYSLSMEYSRIFGITNRRVWMMDADPTKTHQNQYTSLRYWVHSTKDVGFHSTFRQLPDANVHDGSGNNRSMNRTAVNQLPVSQQHYRPRNYHTEWRS